MSTVLKYWDEDSSQWVPFSNTGDGYGISELLQSIYPIGSVFISGQSTMPPLIANIGTWVPLEGRVIVGKSSSGTFSTVNATGGAETHTLTAAEMPVHSHTMRNAGTSGGAYGFVDSGSASSSGMLSTGNAGSGAAHNNLQPYKVKYMWERTA